MTASRAFRKGRLDEARRHYLDYVEARPDEPEAWFLLGLVALKAGNRDEALASIEAAARIRPACARYHEMLGQLHRAAGRAEEARRALKTALMLQPDSAKTLLNLAFLEMAEGRAEIGRPLLRRALGRMASAGSRNIMLRIALLPAPFRGAARGLFSPGLDIGAGIAFEKARVLMRHRRSEPAISRLGAVLRRAPDYVPALTRLAQLYIRRDDFSLAAELLDRAAQAAPDDVEIASTRAQALSRIGRPREALAVLEAVPPERRDVAVYQRALGWSRYRNDQATLAIEPFEKAHRLGGGNAEGSYALGRCLSSLARFDEAEAHLKRALEIEPRHAPAIRALADNKQLSPDQPFFETVLALTDDPEMPLEMRASLNFAAGGVFHASGETEHAFTHFARANALKDVVFSPEVWSRYIDEIRDTFDAAYFERTKGFGDDSTVPVFVVGMPRSGTTLTEQIIGSHPDAFGAGERDTIHYAAHGIGRTLGGNLSFPASASALDAGTARRLAGQYLSEIRDHSPDAKRIVDKMPRNLLYLGIIATLFPNARIIHCRRNPMDTCLSIYFQSFSGHHPYGYDLRNLGHYYRECQRLMDHWRDVLPIEILDVDYENVVADQRAATERLLGFCGLPWDDRCLEFYNAPSTVRTASYTQVRQPIYNSSVERWRRYEAYLGPLKEALGLAA